MAISIKKQHISRYDLTEIAYLKVPKSQHEQLTKITEKTNLHWSELARMILDDSLKSGEQGVSE